MIKIMKMKRKLTMSKQIIALIVLIISTLPAYTQISITSSDMAKPGDIVVNSVGINLDVFNYTQTGEDFYWDFSQLEGVSNTADTFIGINDVPIVYFFYFMGVSNLVKKESGTIPIPSFPITKEYSFLKNSSSSYNNAGEVYTISGLPVPLKFNSPDVLYNFPMEYGNQGSSFAEYSIGLPGVGFIHREIQRNNTVDGWGTLTTPYGTFDVLRQKSEVSEFDSIYLDSLSTGLPLYREYTEYTWIGKDQKIPLLSITTSLGGIIGTYVDSVRVNPSSINQQIDVANNISVFPNPTTGVVNITADLVATADIKIDVFNNFGVKVIDGIVKKNQTGAMLEKINLIDAGLKKGAYIVKISVGNRKTSKVVILL